MAFASPKESWWSSLQQLRDIIFAPISTIVSLEFWSSPTTNGMASLCYNLESGTVEEI